MVTEGGDFTHLIVPHVVREEDEEGSIHHEISILV